MYQCGETDFFVPSLRWEYYIVIQLQMWDVIMCGNDMDHVTCANSILCLSSSSLISSCDRFVQTAQNLSFPLNKVIMRKSGLNFLFVATVFA